MLSTRRTGGLTWTLAGGRRSKAALVGAKIVTGSGPPSLSASPAALSAVTSEEKVGFTARVSNTVQARPHVPDARRKKYKCSEI